MKNSKTKKYISALINTVFALAVLASASYAATFTVTNVNDSGAGSLRQAIISANGSAGADTINFNIAGAGVHSIVLSTPLPSITEGIIINGNTQPGYAGNPLVEIVGNSNILGSGLHISYGAATVRALGIRNFDGSGISVYCLDENLCDSKPPSLILLGSRIGTNTTGTVVFGGDFGNGDGVYINYSDAASSQIGGTGANDRNVISGNHGNGITITAPSGGFVSPSQPATAGYLIINNMIGTNLAGTAAISNEASGISNGAERVTIGGDASAERNIISGNAESGILCSGNGMIIEGNYIGTNTGGTAAIPNGGDGVFLSDDVVQTRIGGLLPGTGNVISGNGANGINAPGSYISGVFGSSVNRVENTLIYANKIGTNAAGSAAIANGANGINMVSKNTVIGLGGNSASANTIAGNANNGIRLHDQFFESGVFADGYITASGAKVQMNYIGTNAAGADLGNGGDGILLDGLVENTLIGGENVSANVIAFNDQNGVEFLSGGLLGGIGVPAFYRDALDAQITANGIYSNGGKGIKLYETDAEGTDALDADTGMNNKQNMPVLTNAYAALITGTFHGAPNTTFAVHFYSSPTCDPAGRGEGKTYLDSIQITTGADGNAGISANFSGASGTFITATATSPSASPSYTTGSTSEFSNCVAQQSSLISKISFSFANYTVNEVAGTATVSVSRQFGGSAPVTVNYATSNGTATAGQDYTATSGLLTFNQGESSKTISIPINNDSFDEVNETINLTLSNPSAGAILISPTSAVLTITDDDAPPTISINDIALAEGNEATTGFTFTVSLSSASGAPVAVNYQTASGTATGGADFQTTSGTINFANGELSKLVTIPVYGEMTVETNETFFVNLSNPVYASIADGQGIGTIQDDDNPGKFSFSLAPYNTGEGSSFATVTVVRTNGDAGTATVDYATTGGTASAFADFTPVSDTLIFLDGETTKTFTVAVLEDQIAEQTESVNLVLANATGGATLGLAAAVVNIIDNDSGTPLAISGKVVKADNTPLANAQINLQGSQTLTTTTDANGDYTFAGLNPNGNYTVAPVAFGYVFNPINRQYPNFSATVTNANFTATAAPTRTIRVVGADTVPGQTAQATVELVAQGDENSVAFSLQFNQGVLSNPQIALGADAPGASLVVNDSQAATGKIGVVMALPAGQTFAAGTKNILTVSFASAQTNLHSTPLDFGSVPTVREVANANADPLSTVWTNGVITFAQGFEGDVTPRPTGNGAVTVSDFTQIGRFVAGLNAPDQLNEFQRADVAPRISKGNGALTVSDYTQAGRYAAGLDALQTAGGATAASLAVLAEDSQIAENNLQSQIAPRTIRVQNVSASPGQQMFVTVEIAANGDENGFGFSVNYDAAKLSNPLVALGADTAGATLIPNTNTIGKVGVLVGLPAGTALPAGTRQLVTIRFNVAPAAPAGQTPVTFGDTPVFREVVDVDANPLAVDFTPGAVNILGPTAATVAVGGRVVDASGSGIDRAVVTITAPNGATRRATTSSFGYYKFEEVEVGETYVFSVASKRYQFAEPTQVLTILDQLDNVNFTAQQLNE